MNINQNKSHIITNSAKSSQTWIFDGTKKAIADAIIGKFETNNNVAHKLDWLYKDWTLYEDLSGKRYMIMNFRRLWVIANIWNCKIPFYQSRFWTEGKTTWNRYPFFWNAWSRLVKWNIHDSKSWYNIPEIKNMMELLNKTLPENIYDSILTSKEKERFWNVLERKNIAQIQEKNPTAYKQFMFSHIQIRDYIAELLWYDKFQTPWESIGAKEFVDSLVHSLLLKLSNK